MNIEQLAILEEQPNKEAPIAKAIWEEEQRLKHAKALQQQSEPVVSKSAYDGAREDLLIWKKRALKPHV